VIPARTVGKRVPAPLPQWILLSGFALIGASVAATPASQLQTRVNHSEFRLQSQLSQGSTTIHKLDKVFQKPFVNQHVFDNLLQ
jgi:hypothetical protein